MVQIVQIVRYIGLGLALLSTALIHATPIDCNPFTITERDTPLNECNPAYGGPLGDNCVATIEIPHLEHCPGGSSDVRTRHLRHLEDASNSDVAKLENYFQESLEIDFKTLKALYASGEAETTPWPGSFFPTYQDSINVVWKAGDKSASAKYAEAYGLDPIDFMNRISVKNGIDSRAKSTQCTSDSDCSSLNDGSVCAKRKDVATGYCTPTWYGLCHAWAPAALLEAEPQCDVVKHGQTFHVMDIKALLTSIYDGSSTATIFMGARFNGPDLPVGMDAYGRYTNDARRDLGAGFFHLALVEILGKHKQAFIMDIASGAEVWNQPVRSYHVKTMKLVDVQQASQQYFGTTTYPFNADMVHLAYVKTTLTWIVEAYADGPLVTTERANTYTHSNDYEYLLELDANDAVIGGEWIGRSKTDHPDFLWFPTAKPDDSTVTSTGLKYADVKELLALSLACGTPKTTSSTTNSTSLETTSNANGETANAENAAVLTDDSVNESSSNILALSTENEDVQVSNNPQETTTAIVAVHNRCM